MGSDKREYVESVEYANLQKEFYNSRISDRDSAKTLVGCYDEGALIMPSLVQFMLDECKKRRKLREDLNEFKVLDVGCGLGRTMKACKKKGIGYVDGVDISEEMLSLAHKDNELNKSKFYLASGMDCGEAPENHYDLIYSLFCLQHICHHDNRMLIIESMKSKLNDNGLIILEFQYYPTVGRGDIPEQHAFWDDNLVSDKTNSEADVWITADGLASCLRDIGEFFSDISLQFMEVNDINSYDQSSGYENLPYEKPFFQLYIAAAKKRDLIDAMSKI